MEKNSKIDLFEMGWGDEQEDQPQEGEPSQAGDQATEAFANIDLLNKLDQDFETIYKSVTQNDNEELKLFSSKMQKIELGKFASAVSKRTSTKTDELQDDIDQLMNTDVDDILKIFSDNSVQNNRKKLYDLYNEISNINPIAYRMLQVYINNILVKNMQTKQFINIVENDINPQVKVLDKEVSEHIQKFIKMLILYFDIQTKLKNKVLPETLKFGDYYVELVDLGLVDDILDKKITILQESCENVQSNKTALANMCFFEDMTSIDTNNIVDMTESQDSYEISSEGFAGKMAGLLKNKKGNFTGLDESDINFWDDVMRNDQDFKIEEFSQLDFDTIEDIYLKLIEPSQVLKIEKDGYHYGYLVIEDLDDDNDPNNEINLYQRFLKDGAADGNPKNAGKQEEILADKMVDSISTKLSELITHDVGFLSDIPQELKSSLRIIAYEKIRKKTKLKFRFLQPDKLINFHTNIDKFAPYGTSVFDPIVVPVKMYTIATMSSVISRLSRAAVIRKWNIEVGTKRNYPEIIEKVKKDLRSKSISYNDLSSIKNISQVMTDFRDIAVISQNGQKFIDMEIMPMQDRALPLNDLQDLRNELVAATGIPSVYLNIGDAIELRETLVNLNIGFANTINTYQGYFEDSLNKLMNSIFDIILKKNNYQTDFKLSQYFKLTMNAPLVLQLQNNEATITTIGNIIGLLDQAKVQISPIELFKMYAPNVDWDQLTKTGEDAIKEEVKNDLIKGGGGGGSGY